MCSEKIQKIFLSQFSCVYHAVSLSHCFFIDQCMLKKSFVFSFCVSSLEFLKALLLSLNFETCFSAYSCWIQHEQHEFLEQIFSRVYFCSLVGFRGQICNGIARPFEFDFPICYQPFSESATLKIYCSVMSAWVTMSDGLHKSPYLCFEYKPPPTHTHEYTVLYSDLFYTLIFLHFIIYLACHSHLKCLPPTSLEDPRLAACFDSLLYFQTLYRFGRIVGRHRPVRADLSPTPPDPFLSSSTPSQFYTH